MTTRRGVSQPRWLILYIYGAFVRRLGGWLAVTDLIRLMGDLRVDEAAVRSAVTRMKQRGLLTTRARAGLAGYGLTPEARKFLDAGDRRILAAQQPAELNQGWVLVVFSVPETKRDRRHLIRTRLTWLGFGTVAPGVWIAPRRSLDEVQAALAAPELEAYVELFEVRHTALEAARRLVERCWDLERLGRMYAAFSERWEPVLDRWSRAPLPDGREAFIDYIGAISQWRRLPFLDPGLPSELLPSEWAGERATWIHFSLLDRLDTPAFEYVKSVVRIIRPAPTSPG